MRKERGRGAKQKYNFTGDNGWLRKGKNQKGNVELWTTLSDDVGVAGCVYPGEHLQRGNPGMDRSPSHKCRVALNLAAEQQNRVPVGKSPAAGLVVVS